MKHEVVGADEFSRRHAAFQEKEKAFTQEKDALSRARRELPWRLVEKDYLFEGPDGKKTLMELFAGKSQLILQHFMYGPGWKQGCEGCSFMADHINGPLIHLEQRDVHFVAVSRAPLADIEAFKKRMGWNFPWYSSHQSDFNFDFHVSFTKEDEAKGKITYSYTEQEYAGDELPGMSTFYKDESGKIFHTYSTFGRGAEAVLGTYSLLDMLPKGRDEEPFKIHPMEWVKRHDEYGHAAKEGCCH